MDSKQDERPGAMITFTLGCGEKGLLISRMKCRRMSFLKFLDCPRTRRAAEPGEENHEKKEQKNKGRYEPFGNEKYQAETEDHYHSPYLIGGG